LVAKACAPRGWRFNEVAGAVHRLPCDARCRGHAAETPYAFLRNAPVGHLPQVSYEARWSAQPRPLRFSAPRQARQPLGAHALAEALLVHHRLRSTILVAAAGLALWGRFSGVAVSGGLGLGAPVARLVTDSRWLSERSAASAQRVPPRQPQAVRHSEVGKADHPG